MGTLLDIEALQIFYELIRPLKHRLAIKIEDTKYDEYIIRNLNTSASLCRATNGISYLT